MNDKEEGETISGLEIRSGFVESLNQLEEIYPGFAQRYLDEYILYLKQYKRESRPKQNNYSLEGWTSTILGTISLAGAIYLGSIDKAAVAITIVSITSALILSLKVISAFTPDKQD